MSCIHVTCHVPMSHVMYLCHIPTVRSFTCNDNHILTNFYKLVTCYVMWHVMSYHISCVMSHVMSRVTCQVSCHVSWHKSSNVKYLATHILLIVLNNYLTNLTILSNVMYPCHKSCTHVTCHVSMWHVMIVMYPCHM